MFNMGDYTRVEIFDHKTGNRFTVPFYKIKGNNEFVKTIYTNQGKDIYVKDDYPNIDKVRDHAFYQMIGMLSPPDPSTLGDPPPPPGSAGPYSPDAELDVDDSTVSGSYSDTDSDDTAYHRITPSDPLGTDCFVNYSLAEVSTATVYNDTQFSQIQIDLVTFVTTSYTGTMDVYLYNVTDSHWVAVSTGNAIGDSDTSDQIIITDTTAIWKYIYDSGSGWDIQISIFCQLSGGLGDFYLDLVDVTYTYTDNNDPVVDDGATITNSDDDGDGTDMFSRYRKYRFRANVSDADGFDDIDYVLFRFYSLIGDTKFEFTYDEDNSGWSETTNTSHFELVTGDCANTSSGNDIELTAYLYIEWECPDGDYAVTTWAFDTYGRNDYTTTGGYGTETDVELENLVVDDSTGTTIDRGEMGCTFTISGTVDYEGYSLSPDDNGEDNIDIYAGVSVMVATGDTDGLSSSAFSITMTAESSVTLTTYYIWAVKDGGGAGGTMINATAASDTYITDRIAVQVYMQNDTHTGTDHNILFNVSLHYEYDNTDVTGATVTMNANATTEVGSGWYQLIYTRSSVYECTFNTIVVSADPTHGVTTVNQNSTSISAIWDKIHIRLTNSTHSIFALNQDHEYLTLASCYYEFCGTNLTLQWNTASDYYTLNTTSSYSSTGWRWIGVATVSDTSNHSITSFVDTTVLNIMWEDVDETLTVTWTEESEALWYLILEITDIEWLTYGGDVPDGNNFGFRDNSTLFATVVLLNTRATGVNSYTPAWQAVVISLNFTYVGGEYNFTAFDYYTNTYDVPAFSELYLLEFEQILEEDVHYVSYSTNWANTTITYYDNNTIQAATAYTSEGMDLEFTRSWIGGLHIISCYINGTAAGASGSYVWVNFSYYVSFVELNNFVLSIGENYIYAILVPNKDATAYVYENDTLVTSGSIIAEGTTLSWLRNNTRGLIMVGIYIYVTATDYVWLNSSYDNGIYAALAVEGWTFFLDGGWCHIQVDPTVDCTGYIYENDTLITSVSPWTIDELGSNTYWQKDSTVGVMRVGIYLNTSGGSDIWLNTSYATSVTYDYMKIRIFNTKYELLPFDQFNVYINDSLVLFDEDYVRTDRVYTIKVCDRFGTELNSTNYSFDRHLDIIITVYLFKIYNYANTHFYLKITQNDTTYEWTDYIGPNTPRPFWLYEGQYILTVYDWTGSAIVFSYLWRSFHGEDKSVVITGTAIDDLIDYINDIDEEIAEMLGETMQDMGDATARQGMMTWLFMIIFVFLAIIVGAVWSRRRGKERTAEEAAEEIGGLNVSQMPTDPYAEEEEELNKDLDDYGSEYY